MIRRLFVQHLKYKISPDLSDSFKKKTIRWKRDRAEKVQFNFLSAHNEIHAHRTIHMYAGVYVWISDKRKQNTKGPFRNRSSYWTSKYRVYAICVQYTLKFSLFLSISIRHLLFWFRLQNQNVFFEKRMKDRKRKSENKLCVHSICLVNGSFSIHQLTQSFLFFQYLYNTTQVDICVFSRWNSSWVTRIMEGKIWHQEKSQPIDKIFYAYISSAKPDQSGKCLSCQFDHCFSNSKKPVLLHFFPYLDKYLSKSYKYIIHVCERVYVCALYLLISSIRIPKKWNKIKCKIYFNWTVFKWNKDDISLCIPTKVWLSLFDSTVDIHTTSNIRRNGQTPSYACNLVSNRLKCFNSPADMKMLIGWMSIELNILKHNLQFLEFCSIWHLDWQSDIFDEIQFISLLKLHFGIHRKFYVGFESKHYLSKRWRCVHFEFSNSFEITFVHIWMIENYSNETPFCLRFVSIILSMETPKERINFDIE